MCIVLDTHSKRNYNASMQHNEVNAKVIARAKQFAEAMGIKAALWFLRKNNIEFETAYLLMFGKEPRIL
jgi:hypothetical protein